MHDPWWMRAFLAVHIAAGGGAFMLAPLALITAKGGKAHRMWGRFYFWCMTIVAFTALVMATYRPVLFLALVAIFSFYASFSAYRVLGQKAAWKGAPVVRGLDWVAAIFCFAASLTLAVLGVVRPELVQNLRIPAIVFGAVGMRTSGRSMWRFTHPPAEKMFWWYAHLQGMIGSYIALDCLLARHNRPVAAWSLVVVDRAHLGRHTRHCRHDGLLSAEVCSSAEGRPFIRSN